MGNRKKKEKMVNSQSFCVKISGLMFNSNKLI